MAPHALCMPPHGDLPASAHDMGREYRVLSVLYKGFPLAPREWADEVLAKREAAA
jgi:hypothetical protein